SSAFLRMTRLPGRLRRGHCLTLPRLEAANYLDRDIAPDTPAMQMRSRLRGRLRVRVRLLLRFGAPAGPARRRTRRRGGAAHGCAAFSAEASMPPRKIPPAPRTRCAAPGAQAGVCFLCAGFLCTSKERWLAPSRRESSWTSRGCCHCQAKKDQGQLAALAPHPPSGHLPPQAGEGLKLYRARRRGVLTLRQISLHKQRKVAGAVTARKLLILMSAVPGQQAGQDPPYEALAKSGGSRPAPRGFGGTAGGSRPAPRGCYPQHGRARAARCARTLIRRFAPPSPAGGRRAVYPVSRRREKG